MAGKSEKPDAVVDLHRLSEDERIAMIGNAVLAHGATVAVFVDATPGKADRYAQKLRDRFPGIAILDVTNGPTPGVVTLRVGAQ